MLLKCNVPVKHLGILQNAHPVSEDVGGVWAPVLQGPRGPRGCWWTEQSLSILDLENLAKEARRGGGEAGLL